MTLTVPHAGSMFASEPSPLILHTWTWTCVHLSGFCIVLVDDHVLHVHVYIVPTMLTELLYPFQDGGTPLHLVAIGGHTACMKHLLSTPGINLNIMDKVSWSIERCCVVVLFDW